MSECVFARLRVRLERLEELGKAYVNGDGDYEDYDAMFVEQFNASQREWPEADRAARNIAFALGLGAWCEAFWRRHTVSPEVLLRRAGLWRERGM